MIPALLKDDTTGIVYRRWDTPSPRAVFLLIHGLGAHTGRWEFLGEYFSQSGIASYALELKGFGQSGGPGGHVESLAVYDDDILRMKGIALREHPGRKIFLVGESMGALITYLLAARVPGISDGLICMSPAFASRILLGFFDYLAIFFSFYFNPRKPFRAPFDSNMCTRDPEYRKVMDASQDETRTFSVKTLGNIALAQLRAKVFRHKISMPLLFLVAEEDMIVDPGVAGGIFQSTIASDKSIMRYPGMYHALSIDLGRENVFADILKWVDARL